MPYNNDSFPIASGSMKKMPLAATKKFLTTRIAETLVIPAGIAGSMLVVGFELPWVLAAAGIAVAIPSIRSNKFRKDDLGDVFKDNFENNVTPGFLEAAYLIKDELFELYKESIKETSKESKIFYISRGETTTKYTRLGWVRVTFKTQLNERNKKATQIILEQLPYDLKHNDIIPQIKDYFVEIMVLLNDYSHPYLTKLSEEVCVAHDKFNAITKKPSFSEEDDLLKILTTTYDAMVDFVSAPEDAKDAIIKADKSDDTVITVNVTNKDDDVWEIAPPPRAGFGL